MEVIKTNKKLITDGSYISKEIWHMHQDGTVFPMLMNGIYVKDDNNNHQFTAITATDITERVKSEKVLKKVNEALINANDNILRTQTKMLQQEKLASIGHLAAGVAHELNNPLGFVANNINTLKKFITKIKAYISSVDEFIIEINNSKNSKIEESIDNINSIKKKKKINFILDDIDELFDESAIGFERVTSIIQSLRNFSRVDFLDEVGSYDINNAIEDTLIVIGNEINSIVTVDKNFSENPLIECKGGEINLVLLNIIINAAHAIESQERSDFGKIIIDTYHDNKFVICKISDNGPGIPKINLSKIFDPFFTTKEEGKGAGLGLNICYDIIVNKHKGEISVENQVENGATFIIKLPIHHQTNNKE